MRRILLRTFVVCCAIALSSWLGAPMHIVGAPVATDDASRCRTCHAYEADGFARSKMASSMRAGDREPEGLVRASAATITMHADKTGSWQTFKSGSDTTSYHVDYVIGSGTHANGSIVNLSDHLFQSPVAYYRRRGGYDLAPGYESIEDPDFTRPVQEGCLLADPNAHNIVNPAKLEPAAYAALSDAAEAERHLEKATDLDPLNLAAASQLISLYKTNGDAAKAEQLFQRITSLVQTGKHEP